MSKKNPFQPKSPFYMLFRAFQFILTLSLLGLTIYLRWGYKIKGDFESKEDTFPDLGRSTVSISSFRRDQSENTDDHDNPDNYAITKTDILSPFIGLAILMGVAFSSAVHSLIALITYHRKTLSLTFTFIWDLVLTAVYIPGFSLIGKSLSDIDAWGTGAPIIRFYKAVFGAAVVAMVSFFATGVVGFGMRREAKNSKKNSLPTTKYEPLDDGRANLLSSSSDTRF